MSRYKARATSDEYCRKHHGCTAVEFADLRQMGRDLRASGAPIRRMPIRAFQFQRNHAARRGVGWELSLWQWWTIWRDSGHWEQRGIRHDQYVMCRKGDEGPYAVGNVFIALAIQNHSDVRHKKSNLPIGVVKQVASGRVFYRSKRAINGKQYYLGCHKTPEEAHAAYLRAGAA